MENQICVYSVAAKDYVLTNGNSPSSFQIQTHINWKIPMKKTIATNYIYNVDQGFVSRIDTQWLHTSEVLMEQENLEVINITTNPSVFYYHTWGLSAQLWKFGQNQVTLQGRWRGNQQISITDFKKTEFGSDKDTEGSTCFVPTRTKSWREPLASACSALFCLGGHMILSHIHSHNQSTLMFVYRTNSVHIPSF